MSITRSQSKIAFKAKKNTHFNDNKKKSKNAHDGCSKVEIVPTPKKSLDPADINCVTPSTALSSLAINSPTPQSGFSSARKAFHSESTTMPCRENELATLEKFVYSNIEKENSGSLYMSGLPGTGKTASISQIIENIKEKKSCNVVVINCTAMKSSGAVYIRICEALKIKLSTRSERCAQLTVEKYLSRRHKMLLLILDEIDQLESKYQSILYTIFEWPSRANSRLLLIGIANAVDLTDRLLPRLSASLVHQPILLHFRPYTKDEILTILKHRLTQVGETEIFAPGALELISAKVACQSGDVRRALDLGRRVLEISKGAKENVQFLSSLEDNLSIRRSPRKINSLEKSSPDKSKRALNFMSPVKTSIKEDIVQPNLSLEKVFSPRKRVMSSVLKESLECSPNKRSKEISLLVESPKRKLEDRLKSPRCSLFSDSSPSKVSQTTPKKLDLSPVRSSPRKSALKFNSPIKAIKNEADVRRSPRKAAEIDRKDYRHSVHARDVLTVVDQMYGTAKNLNGQKPAFPLHQKLVLCSLTLVLTKGKRKDINVNKLKEVYSKVCSKRGLTAVDQSEFVTLCRQIETAGAIELGKGPVRLAKVNLLWDEAEVAAALQDTSMLAAILKDTSCLGVK